jgi:dUTP pyrophosphatase
MSRSGLSAKFNIDVKVGTIDRDYTGNVLVILENNGPKPFKINIGDRIAQIVLLQHQTPQVAHTTSLPTTAQGDNGFGSYTWFANNIL